MSTADTTASRPRIVSIFRNIEAILSPGTRHLSLAVVTSSAVIRVTRVRDRVVRQIRNHLKKIKKDDTAKLVPLENMLVRITQQDLCIGAT